MSHLVTFPHIRFENAKINALAVGVMILSIRIFAALEISPDDGGCKFYWCMSAFLPNCSASQLPWY